MDTFFCEGCGAPFRFEGREGWVPCDYCGRHRYIRPTSPEKERIYVLQALPRVAPVALPPEPPPPPPVVPKPKRSVGATCGLIILFWIGLSLYQIFIKVVLGALLLLGVIDPQVFEDSDWLSGVVLYAPVIILILVVLIKALWRQLNRLNQPIKQK